MYLTMDGGIIIFAYIYSLHFLFDINYLEWTLTSFSNFKSTQTNEILCLFQILFYNIIWDL